MFHTLSQTEYMRKMFGQGMAPLNCPTPRESRAISELHRYRRAHTELVALFPSRTTGKFGFSPFQVALKEQIAIIREERAKRGM